MAAVLLQRIVRKQYGDKIFRSAAVWKQHEDLVEGVGVFFFCVVQGWVCFFAVSYFRAIIYRLRR